MPGFSIVIPYFNKPYEIALLLKGLSLQDHDLKEVEVVIVDDGSDQPIDGIVEKFRAYFRIQYHRVDHIGNRSKLRNLGAERCREGWLVFLDSDMVPCRTMLSSFAEDLGQEGCVTLGTRRLMFDYRKEYIGEETVEKDFEVLERMPALEDERILYMETLARTGKKFAGEWHLLFSHCFGIRKADFNRVGGFDPIFGENWGAEDVELGYRLVQAGGKINLNRGVVCYHVWHPSDARKKISQLKSNYRLFIRKHPHWQVELFTREYETFINETIRMEGLILAKKHLLGESRRLSRAKEELRGRCVLFGIDADELVEDARVEKVFAPESRKIGRKVLAILGIETPYADDEFDVALVSKGYDGFGKGFFQAILREAARISKRVLILAEDSLEVFKDGPSSRERGRFLRMVLGAGKWAHFNRLYFLQLALRLRGKGVTVQVQSDADAFNQTRINNGYLKIGDPAVCGEIDDMAATDLAFLSDSVPTLMDPAACRNAKFLEKRILWHERAFFNEEKIIRSEWLPNYGSVLARRTSEAALFQGPSETHFLPIGVDVSKVVEREARTGIRPEKRECFHLLWSEMLVSRESNLELVLEAFDEAFGSSDKAHLTILVPPNQLVLNKSLFTNDVVLNYHLDSITHRQLHIDAYYRSLLGRYFNRKNISFVFERYGYEDFLDYMDACDNLIHVNSRIEIPPSVLYSLAFGKKPLLGDRMDLGDYVADDQFIPLATEVQSALNLEKGIESHDDHRVNRQKYASYMRFDKASIARAMVDLFEHPGKRRMDPYAVQRFRSSHDWDRVAERFLELMD